MEELQQGSSLSDSFRRAGAYFPAIFHELLAVGETTGRTDEVLLRLGSHFRHIHRLQMIFLSATAWPVIQLIMAQLAIALVIYLPEVLLPDSRDLLGFGMVGTTGLVKYAVVLGVFYLAVALIIRWFRNPRNRARAKAIAIRVPFLTGYFTADAMARFCWTLGVCDDAGLDIRKSVDAALRGTENTKFISTRKRVLQGINQGDSLAHSIARVNSFPDETVAALEVGESSGRLGSTLDHLSEQYRKQAEANSDLLVRVASVAVWLFVAALIIFCIFSIAMQIGGIYNEFLEPV